MNGVLIVLPILSLLMFELGINLQLKDFLLLRQKPLPVIIGLTGQIIVLPLLAFFIGILFKLEPVYFLGLMLIACSPGGSSSNVFSMLAKGDVALSVSLTALSSLITLITIPVILEWSIHYAGTNLNSHIELPMGKLLLQNLVLMLVPIALGVAVKHFFPKAAHFMHRILSKIAFPCLMLLAAIFFLQHKTTIIAEFTRLGSCVSLLILSSIFAGLALAKAFRLPLQARRTIIIEIGMQNAAQSIAIASSPFIFNNNTMAIPAIIYALMMNIILLIYVGCVKSRSHIVAR